MIVVIELRPYQRAVVEKVRELEAAGRRRIVCVAPCGSGKTVIAGSLIRQAVTRGEKALFFVHRRELIQQVSDTCSRLGVDHALICADSPMDLSKPLQLASVQTLINRQIPPPDLLICDECHHILADSYLKILERFKGARLLGFTATPLRMGGQTLGDVFEDMVLAPDVAQLINLGALADFDMYAPPTLPVLKGLKVVAGEYCAKELERLMSRFVVSAVEQYRLHANAQSAICYCAGVNHSKLVAHEFAKSGIPAAHCDGKTPKSERAQILEDLRAGRIKILCNAELFGEGLDVPEIGAVILARPTKSLTLYTQQAMRALRPKRSGGKATIIDLTGVSLVFGRPDVKRKWSLAPAPEKESGEAPAKQCPKCGAIVPAGARYCNCGYEFEIEVDIQPADKLEMAGRTIEYWAGVAKRKGYKLAWAMYRALETVRSYDELEHIADFMNYKRGWAWHQAQRLDILRG